MPTFNKVINQKIFKTVANGSKQIKIGWATQTDTWERLHLAETIQENFAKAVEKAADNGELPTKGAKVIMT